MFQYHQFTTFFMPFYTVRLLCKIRLRVVIIYKKMLPIIADPAT